MLHINFVTKMFHCSTHVVARHIFECIAHHNKICMNAARLFYNDKNSIDYLLQYLRKRQGIIDLKTEDDRRNASIKRESSSPMDSLIFVDPVAPETHHFFTFNLGDWWERKKVQYRKELQKQRYERHQALGPDLATAKVILRSGGRVKFANYNDWIDSTNKEEVSKIPNEYQSDFILEGLDLRGYPLEYENLYIICNLYHLKWLSLRGCDTINDWSLDKLSTEYPTLEYLDISECKNVTERGLEALYRMPNLDQLIVTNFHDSVAFELTCLMLEDVNPYLKCQILKPEDKLLLIHGHEKNT